MKLKQLDGTSKNELSMIEVAHAIFEENGDVLDFNQLLVQIQDYLEMSEEELEGKMTRFYTDLNIDGSFISLGENRWGLRSWYPIDSIDEEILSSIDEDEVKVRRKKRKKLNAFATSEDDDDVIDYNDDDPEDIDVADEDEEIDVDEDEVDDVDAVDITDDDDDITSGIEEDLTLIIEEEDLEDEEEFEEEEEFVAEEKDEEE